MTANSDLPEAPTKWVCEECGGFVTEHLTAVNPFDPDDEIVGCPLCKSVSSLRQACQIGACNKPASGGYPRGHGFRYVWTCYHHRPAATPDPD